LGRDSKRRVSAMVDRSEFVARRIVNLMVVFAVLVVFYGANALGHEGHKPLPTRGVEVDLEGGAMVVSPEALGALVLKPLRW